MGRVFRVFGVILRILLHAWCVVLGMIIRGQDCVAYLAVTSL